MLLCFIINNFVYFRNIGFMKFYSLLKKAVNLTTVNLLSPDNFIAPSLYLCNLDIVGLVQARKILFYFDSNEYMHLGDHLFFLPLVKNFVDSGFDVEVRPTKIMQPLFEKLGFSVVAGDLNLDAYDLIISRIEIIRGLSKYKSLLVNVSKNLTMPVCDQLISDFSQFFNLRPPQKIDYTQLKDSTLLNRLSLIQDKKLILFNLYCDSAAYLINQHKIDLLLNLVKDYANKPGYQLVLVGAASDIAKDKHKLDFPYVDIRGKTSVLEIFNLVNNDNVFCYIGFDAFVMHVFSLLQKPSFVVFRGRVRKRQHEMLKRYHVNLFKHDNFVTLLN